MARQAVHNNSGKMSVCIVSHNAYGSITGGKTGHVGGVEHQTSMTARWLAKRGHHVSLLTWNEGGPDEETIEGVRIIKMCRGDAGLKGLRFFHPRWTSLNQAMKKTDAELYYHNCAEYVTGQVALWCSSHGRRFIYSVASDADCERVSPDTRKFYVRQFYRYGIKRADRIIVQTESQRRKLLHNFGLESVVLPMPCAGIPSHESQKSHPDETGKQRVLWVGRIDAEKRLELLLDVAEALPEVTFDVAGKPSNVENSYSIKVLARAKSIHNVNVHGMVPRDRMADLYRNASLLCCTSIYEGFPNTFLEAWSCGLPIVSTYDPDDLIQNKKLGIFTKDRAELISGIQLLLGSSPKWQVMSENAIQYYNENHALVKAMQRFENLFLETLGAEK